MKRRVSTPPLSLDAAEIAWWTALKNNPTEEQKNEFVQRYERLVKRWAQHVFTRKGRSANANMEVADLEAEGWRVAFEAAIRGFNPHRGIQFTTYFTRWLNQAMCREVERAAIIHLPTDKVIKLSKLWQLIEQHQAQTGSNSVPAIEILCEATGLTRQTVECLLAYNIPLSMDAFYDDDDGTSLGSLIIDTGPSPVELVLLAERNKQLQVLLGRLLPRERRVLMSRVCDGETLEVIAKRERLSREGVRHIQNRAMRKIKEYLILPEFAPMRELVEP